MLEAETFTLPGTSLIQLVPQRSIVSIAAFRGQAAALDAALGITLPTTPRRVGNFLWSGPNVWLAISEEPIQFENIQHAAAVTDQSDGVTLFRVIGPNIRKILAKLVPIDLRPSAFPSDAVAITLAAHIGIRIWQEDDGAFILACFRSFAGALHHALIEASHEFDG